MLRQHLTGWDMDKKAHTAAHLQDWAEARADVTLYPIWHKSSPAAMLQDYAESNATPVQTILKTEAIALSDCVHPVGRFSYTTGANDDVPVMPESVRTSIDHDK